MDSKLVKVQLLNVIFLIILFRHCTIIDRYISL